MTPNYSALILAGGRGERFWPWSRPDRPKQLLPLVGSDSLLEATLDRLAAVIPPERTWILTGRLLVEPVKAMVGDRARVVAEPVGRNTAPAVSLGAMLALAGGQRGAMAVLPADHLIPEIELFQETMTRALDLAEREAMLVTLGIPPRRPETGYGYIERGTALVGSTGAYRVESFREKPDAATARGFVKAGNFFWNSGMFFWRPEVILDAVRRHRPELARGLERFEGRLGEDQLESALEELFPELEAISVDYAVMEHAANVAMLEAPFEWDDLGSWKAWARWQPKDASGNVVQGEVVLLDSENCVVVGEGAPVAVIGVKDLVIVQKNGATLICPLDRAEEVRRAVNELQKREKS
jgi:mannose-1-phosphate guanylyltransferase